MATGRAVVDAAIAQIREDGPMSWESRDGHRYYYRAVRRDVRTVKEYVGRGPAAELAARLDARARRGRERAAEASRAERARCDPAEQVTTRFDDLCEMLISASLHAAGYHRHRSGPWMRRRHGRADAPG